MNWPRSSRQPASGGVGPERITVQARRPRFPNRTAEGPMMAHPESLVSGAATLTAAPGRPQRVPRVDCEPGCRSAGQRHCPCNEPLRDRPEAGVRQAAARLRLTRSHFELLSAEEGSCKLRRCTTRPCPGAATAPQNHRGPARPAAVALLGPCHPYRLISADGRPITPSPRMNAGGNLLAPPPSAPCYLSVVLPSRMTGRIRRTTLSGRPPPAGGHPTAPERWSRC